MISGYQPIQQSVSKPTSTMNNGSCNMLELSDTSNIYNINSTKRNAEKQNEQG